MQKQLDRIGRKLEKALDISKKSQAETTASGDRLLGPALPWLLALAADPRAKRPQRKSSVLIRKKNWTRCIMRFSIRKADGTMTIKTRLKRLEKYRKNGDKKLIVAFDDCIDPTHVTVEGKRMTQGKFSRLAARVGEDAILLHVVYRNKVVDA